MKMAFKLMMFLFTACAATDAQVVPEATGPTGLPVSGDLHYDLHYSQTAEFGGSLGNWQTANASGDAGYANGNTRLPFRMNYTGGYTWTITGPSYLTGLFQHLFLSQGFVWHKWSVMASDDVSYTPQAPTTGFSGVPGTGEPIGTPNPTPASDQSILTVNTHVIDNNANGELQRQLTSATTLSVGATSILLRYPNGNGTDTDSLMANAGLTRRLNARNSLLGQYTYSQYSYPGYGFSIRTNTGLFSYSRTWSRRLSTTVGAGPEWIDESDIAGLPPALASTAGTTASPGNSTRISGNAEAKYQMRFGSASVSYNHATSGGAGYLAGAEVDSVDGNFTRDFGRNLTIGITGAYRRTDGLVADEVISGKYGGAQATRRLGRYLTLFANYTATDQSTNPALATNTLSQLLQVIGFGIGYSPRETHLRR
jgi:hypothetical protein